MQPGDDLLDYRARAAACRAKAAKAAEHRGEANTWLQVAAMWDGLADRLENGADAAPRENGAGPVPLGRGAPEPDAASATEAAPKAEHKAQEELSPRELLRSPLLPVAQPAAEPRSPRLRRVAVVAGLLLIALVVAVLVLWPRTDRPMGLAGQSASPEAGAGPRTPITAPAGEEPVAKMVQAAQPAQGAPVQKTRVPTGAGAPPSPNPPLAAAPPEAGPEPPKAEPEIKAVGQEPDPAAQDAQPPAEAGLSLPASADTAPAALPPAESPPAAAVQLGAVVGTWWPDACPKPAERKNAVPMVLTEDRARAGAASCAFQRKTPAASGWTIVARCSDGRESWTAHIRLVHAGKRLSWASERGSLTYFRCS